MSGLPAELGYWLAPDWQKHDHCWLAWPHRPESWAGLYEHACLAHAALARAICDYEPVSMLVRPGFEKEARLQLGPNVNIVPAALDDSWLRDIGPGFLINEAGARAAAAFGFNGWGNKVRGYAQDAGFAQWLLSELQIARYDCPLVMESGGIQVDSVGTLIALESGILDANRNPTHDRQLVEELLATFLGVRKIIWLDDTHMAPGPWRQTVDIVRFCGPAKLLCAAGYGAGDPLARDLDDMAGQLAGERDALGRPLQIARVARAMPRDDGEAAAGLGSYLNFYIANGAIVVPAFDAEADAPALAAIADAFPGRDAVSLDVGVLRDRGMGWHSLTLPVPQSG